MIEGVHLDRWWRLLHLREIPPALVATVQLVHLSRVSQTKTIQRLFHWPFDHSSLSMYRLRSARVWTRFMNETFEGGRVAANVVTDIVWRKGVMVDDHYIQWSMRHSTGYSPRYFFLFQYFSWIRRSWLPSVTITRNCVLAGKIKKDHEFRSQLINILFSFCYN